VTMTFQGIPVFLEFDSHRRVYEIVTVGTEGLSSGRLVSLSTPAHSRLTAYEVDWCDTHGHYHAHANGGKSLPMRVTHRVGEGGEKAPTSYWAAPQIPVELAQGADPDYCRRIEAGEVLPLLLADAGEQEEFLGLHELLSSSDMLDAHVPALVQYWSEVAFDTVEEGEVVYCALCQANHDYEAGAPCEHLGWCYVCGHWSTPPAFGAAADCPHRSPDGSRYIDPQEPGEEDLQELWQALAEVPLICTSPAHPQGVLACDFFLWECRTPLVEVHRWFVEYGLEDGGRDAKQAAHGLYSGA
jgi:hypothetical protein